MERDEFWALIEEARITADGDAHEQVELLVDRLRRLSPAEIRFFSRQWDLVTHEGHIWDLVGAAYVLDGYVSDDHFDYFRPWLMMHGRDVWEAAVADVENLADAPLRFVNGWPQLEDALYMDVRAYGEATGRGEDAFYEDMTEDDREEHRRLALAPLRGVPLPETDEECARCWPRLWARYAARPERLAFIQRLEEAVNPHQPTW
ncbi:DUF4240 domain-containing protein [Actinomadura craniellae]|uniref:DUF4240 domain-containing protein n=1 Tax=Actinomadura craniellae TaxID=2231787 RepID=UPI0013141099|nr:DUF4240 domain-containing protein [Actinomadura craniellae]